ncbi:alpha-galactosidase 1 [Hortaea werneckii]|nr:alpha-galactosidase 1 [Hortaea werneckii]
MPRNIIFAISILPAVLALERTDNIGKLPALGWNSWDKILAAAQAMVDLGFKDAGYEYVILDDCWSIKDGRDPSTNRLQPDLTKFRAGMNGTADKVHSSGLKFGMYSSAGTQTGASYPGSLGYEAIDAETFAEWGVDYLKTPETEYYTWPSSRPFCATEFPVDGVDYSISKTAQRFKIMENALLEQERTILYSLCQWTNWARVLEILNVNSFVLDYTNFWGRNGPDILEVVNGLSLEEDRSHFAPWAMMKGPLLMGTDLTKLDQARTALLKNKYLLAFNQDNLIGEPAKPYKWGQNDDRAFNSSFSAMYWSGASTNGTMVAMFNPLGSTISMSAIWEEISQLEAAGRCHVFDVWTEQDRGCIENKMTTDVVSHDTAVYLIASYFLRGSKPDI